MMNPDAIDGNSEADMLHTSIGGIVLKSCVYNASGPRCGTSGALDKIGESESSVILSKSSTLHKQDGNELPRFVKSIDLGQGICNGSFNSEGLPNLGIDHYIAPDTLATLARHGKPYMISLSGRSLDDNCDMLRRVLRAAHEDPHGYCIHGVELNVACPNVVGKPMIGYDMTQLKEVLHRICTVFTTTAKENRSSQVANSPNCDACVRLGIKLPPYMDSAQAAQAIDLIISHKDTITFVVSCNTIGNALFVDTDNECCSISGKGGFGGLGGGYLKAIALANTRTLSLLLHERNVAHCIDIVAVGGIHSGDDAFQAILCGASAIQLATVHWDEGPTCFGRIAEELRIIMKRKGYSCLEQFRGKLKQYQPHKSCIVTTSLPSADKNNRTKHTEEVYHLKIVIVFLMMMLLIVYMYIDDHAKNLCFEERHIL